MPRRPSASRPTTATTDVLEAGVEDGAAEERQRVHPPDGGIDEVGLVPLPARLVLLGAAVVVDREQHGVARPRAAAPRYTDDLPQ